MGVIYGGKPCVDPRQLAAECAQADPPVPTETWRGKANSFYWPVGFFSGIGYILLRGKDLFALGMDEPRDLTFANGSDVVTLKNLRPLAAECVTPGGRPNDPNAVYFVRLVDRRRINSHFNGNMMIGSGFERKYNFIAAIPPLPPGSPPPADSTFFPPGNYYGLPSILPNGIWIYNYSLNGVKLWTHEDQASDLWNAADQGGTFIGNPFPGMGLSLPDYLNAVKFNTDFTLGERFAWASLQEFLLTFNRTINLNLTTNKFTIEALDEPTGFSPPSEAMWDKTRLYWDCDPQTPIWLYVPRAIKVRFVNFNDDTGFPLITGTTVTVADPTEDATDTGHLDDAIVFNASPAIFNGSGIVQYGVYVGTSNDRAQLLNINFDGYAHYKGGKLVTPQATLDDAALRMAKAYFPAYWGARETIHKIYSGWGVAADPAMQPASHFQLMCIRDFGDGAKTEVFRGKIPSVLKRLFADSEYWGEYTDFEDAGAFSPFTWSQSQTWLDNWAGFPLQPFDELAAGDGPG